MHRGVDVAGRFPVTAAGDGVVHGKGYNAKGGGHWVRLDHGSGIYTVYYHGREATKLAKGARVSAGDLIYTSGSTGASTGDHLHFEVRKGGNGQWGFDVDPMPYLERGAGPGTQPVRVSGRLDRDTVRRWQELLKAAGHNPGMVDGRMGPRTIQAIQASVGVRPDGQLGPITRAAVQRHLGVRDDGVWGRQTISALQRRLNGGKW